MKKRIIVKMVIKDGKGQNKNSGDQYRVWPQITLTTVVMVWEFLA